MKKKSLFLCMLMVITSMFIFTACGGNSEKNTEGTDEQGNVEPIEIKISATVPTANPSYDRMEAFSNRINEATDNAFDFKIYPSDQLGDYSLALQEVSRGNIEAIVNCFSATVDARGEIMYLPYAAATYAEIDEAFGKNSYIYEAMGQICDDINVKFLGFEFIGFDGVVYSDKAPENIWDVNASKEGLIRTPSDASYIALAKEMGLNGTAINWSEVYSSLQTKVINGSFGPTPSVAYNSFRDVIKSFVPLNYAAELQIIALNKDLWDKFTPEQQKAWQDSADKMFYDSIDETASTDADFIQQLKDHGIDYVEGTPEQLEAYTKHVKETVWPVLEKPLGKEIYTKLMSTFQN